MTTIQKLEISTGTATPIAALIHFFTFIYLAFSSGELKDGFEFFARIFTVVCLFTLLIAVSAYYDITNKGNIAVVALFTSGFIVIIIFGFLGLIVFTYGGILYSLFTITPAILAFITVTLAIHSKVKVGFDS